MHSRDSIQTEFTRLNTPDVTLGHDEFNRLVLTHAGTTWQKVKPMRPFPLSMPDRCIFFLDSDGKQIGFISDTKDLPDRSRTALQEELDLLYFTTKVDSIESVKSRHGVTTWEFITVRGPATVHVKDRNDIRTLPGRRVIFTDTNGMRYEIADTERIDDRSQGLLEAET